VGFAFDWAGFSESNIITIYILGVLVTAVSTSGHLYGAANSLLSVLVREKNGLSYNIEASYTPYSDSGIVAIYFSCDHDNTDHCIELIEGELERLRNTPLSARRLSMAKKQFIAQLAISMESNEGYMLGAGKSFLAHREVDTMEEVYRKIQALTAEDLTDVASSVFSSPSRLIYK